MTIVCIKVGTKYHAEYVNRLMSMVARHTTVYPLRYLCLTDDPKGVICETSPINTVLSDWWSKLILFKPHKALKDERFVYLDLDTVIVDNIDFLFRYNGPFCILQDWWAAGYNSSVIAMVPGYAPRVWNNITPSLRAELHGDQDWITYQIHNADVWQHITPNMIGSYKADKLQNSPGDFRLVCFHGEPKPHEIKDGWVHENWL